MAEVRLLTREEIQELYPINSGMAKKVWNVIDRGLVIVLVKDSDFPNTDYSYQVKVCCDTLRPNDKLIPGKRLNFNCIIDPMVTDEELIAACYSEINPGA